MSLLVTLNGLRLLRERAGAAAPVAPPTAACTDDCCSHG
jgi:hypothetical protein